jgi:hypothetical protein
LDRAFPESLTQKEGIFTVTLMRPIKSREKIKAIIKDNPNVTTIGISESEKRGYY